jgi:N-acylglucosamine 2-epimerase/mannose-6-phosphate isomerase
MFNHALPLWANNGYDTEHQVCCERLALDGSPHDVKFRRVRALARQVYVFSHAQHLGWDGPAESIAENTLKYLIQNAWQGSEAGWRRKLDIFGNSLDDCSDLYDHAFMLFALAWRYKVNRYGGHLQLAKKTVEYIKLHMKAADEWGYAETLPRPSTREQNPHMHMLEALLVLIECDASPIFQREADRLVELMTTKLVDQSTGALREFYTAGWEADSRINGRITEPGHQFEWVWILSQYKKQGSLDVDDTIKRLFHFARRYGIDGETGLTFDQVLDDGRVHQATFRSWPQTETLKAYLAMGELSGKFDIIRINQIVNNIFDYYLNTKPAGLWMDQLNEKRQGTSTFTPSTSLYHFVLAFTELLRLENTILDAG